MQQEPPFDANPPSPPPQPPPAAFVNAPHLSPALATIPPADRQLAMVMHLSALLGYVMPFANLLVPLVIWLLKKDESPALDRVGREVLNFNISILIYAIVSAILMVVLIGFVLLAALWVFGLVVTIIASVRANEGSFYHYPVTIRFL